MIIKIDVENKHVLHNGKVIPIDLWTAISMAPLNTKIEIVNELDEDSVVTVKLHMPK